jgi:hypothetical protein
MLVCGADRWRGLSTPHFKAMLSPSFGRQWLNGIGTDIWSYNALQLSWANFFVCLIGESETLSNPLNVLIPHSLLLLNSHNAASKYHDERRVPSAKVRVRNHPHRNHNSLYPSTERPISPLTPFLGSLLSTLSLLVHSSNDPVTHK